jgi:hypothetical protein
MSKEKITDEYHLLIPHWRESLKNCVNELNTK